MVNQYLFSVVYDVMRRHRSILDELRMVLLQPFYNRSAKLLCQSQHSPDFLFRNHAYSFIISDIAFPAEGIKAANSLGIKLHGKS